MSSPKEPDRFVSLKLPDFSGISQQLENVADRRAGRHDAEIIFQHLVDKVSHFQNSLNDSEELGIGLANFGKAAEFHIRSISYKNPNLIEFSGVDIDGRSITLIQHISQLNFLLTALKPIEEKAYRIGFR